MRAREFVSRINEGGKSDAVRFNSEVALLHIFAYQAPLDLNNLSASFDESKLENPEKVLGEIEKFLVPNFNEKVYRAWEEVGQRYMKIIAKHTGLPPKLGWTGGANAGPVADVEFIGHESSGISVKDAGGITLRNLTPKAIGIEAEKGLDVFRYHAEEKYIVMKQKIFNDVLNIAESQPGEPVVPIKPAYSVTFNPETKTFICKGKKTFEGTREDILKLVDKNASWQRAFGDWFQTNWATKKAYATDLYAAVAKTFEELIEKALQSRSSLENLLAFEDQSYYYATPKSLFYVPAKKDLGDLQLKKILYAQPNGTAQKFIAEVGMPDSKRNAKIEIYVRYANGMFETNPTVRIQSLRDPRYLGWEKLV